MRRLQIKNTIEIGKSITDKTYMLDIKVLLNNDSIVNLELQVLNEGNWTNRSLSYLCRNFDNIQQGEDYNSVIPVTYVGIIDFILFPEYPEFYAKYKLMNEKNHHIYNSKFALNVLSLKQLENATQEDKKWQLDKWAKIFRARTWEELRMVASNNSTFSPIVDNVAEELWIKNHDGLTREQCEARKEQLFHEQYQARRIKELTVQNELQKEELKDKDTTIEKQQGELERLRQLLKNNGIEE